MKNNRNFFQKMAIVFAISMAFTACKPEEKTPIKDADYSNRVFVQNEGQFQVGNSSIFAYNPEDKSVSESIFKAQNNRPLGDILNSGTIIGNYIYWIVNNSNKIEVVDKKTFKSTATIEDFNSPRYLLEVGNNKAYVSSLFGKEIEIINTTSNTKSGKIQLKSTSEQMILHNDKVYVAGSSDSFIYVINTQNDQVEDSIPVGYDAYEMVQAGDFLFVSCLGNFVDIVPTFYKIKLSDNSIVFHKDVVGGVSKLQKNTAETNVYFLFNNGIFKMNVSDNDLPITAFIREVGPYFYGLGIDPKTGDIYAADAKDFTQKGSVIIYKSSGEKINTIDVGIAPNGFVFNY